MLSLLGLGNYLSKEAKLASQKFDSEELHTLKKTWQDLADRSNGKGVDKETFLQYFPLNGLLGERLFARFDVNALGYIDLDEFIIGLATVCRGSLDDKIHFVFDMYNASTDKTVSKQELTTLLNHIPMDVFDQYNMNNRNPCNEQPDQYIDIEQEEMLQNKRDDNIEYEELDFYTHHDMVEKAFEECDLNHEGRLTYEEFKMWVQRTPLIIEYIESILPYNGPKDKNQHTDKRETLPHMKRVTSKVLSRGNSMQDVPSIAGEIFNHSTSVNTKNRISAKKSYLLSRGTSIQSNMSNGNSNETGSFSPRAGARSIDQGRGNHGLSPIGSRNGSSSMDGHHISGQYNGVEDPNEVAVQYLRAACETATDEKLRSQIVELLNKIEGIGITKEEIDAEAYRTVVCAEDYLWKKGKSILHMLSKRFYVLSGNCIYYYTHKHDVRPRGVVFLTGSIIERLSDPDMELKGYYGFELLHQDLCTGEHHRHEKRVLYCKSSEVRDKWVTMLQHAAHVVPIEEDYIIGKELGRGRFSVVCDCLHKKNGMHCAVKIIDKATIEPEEKGLLRTEIAVLKLVNHPNIIRMEGLYEDKTHIYIVMEKLDGGELFERIVGRPRFTEVEAVKLIHPLLESVAYLHDLGIVHRDLKPENILCGDELQDLKIADFGLSKMILPKEKMDSACGTLSYVAPEVLTMQGYGKEADLWSVGVIMFLLLCGKLPFDGEDHNEIIRSTIQADMKVNPTVWCKLTPEAQDMISSLLNKNPKERITARESLKHPWFGNYNTAKREQHKATLSSNNSLRGEEREVLSRASSVSSASNDDIQKSAPNSGLSTPVGTNSSNSNSPPPILSMSTPAVQKA